jgi:hypothetical protein
MRCRSDKIIGILTILFLAQFIGGCVSLQIAKFSDGADVPPPPNEFIAGKTSLREVLSYYGAPTEIVHMNGPFALHYRKTLYRNVGISIGIPLSDVLKLTPNLDARGNLSRYDTVVFVFTPAGLLKDLKYEKGTTRPLWSTFWR